jgi:hypothetical protein
MGGSNGFITMFGFIILGIGGLVSVWADKQIGATLIAVGTAMAGIGGRNALGKVIKNGGKSLAFGLLAAAFASGSVLAHEAGEPDETVEEEGISKNPYGQVSLTRANDDWSTGVRFGVEVTSGWVYLDGRLDLHDIHSNDEVYPWDSTFEMAIGVFSQDYKLFGLPTTPYAGLTLGRPSGPDNWSTGLEFGLEANVEMVALNFTYALRDILSESEVYPWDDDFRLGAGIAF